MTSTAILRPPTSRGVWMLRRGNGVVFLKPSTRRVARVVGGTLFRIGDGVELPSGISWKDALGVREDGDTALSPYELRLAFDSRTGTWTLGPLPDTLSPREARERDLLARDVCSLFESDADPAPPSGEPR